MSDTAAPQMTMDTLMTTRFDLVERIAIVEGRHKAELEPLKEALHLTELVIKDELNKSGMNQVKTSAGMAFFKSGDRVKIEDFAGLTLPFILQNNLLHMLYKDVNKTAVREYIAVHKEPPPGLAYETFRTLNWRKAKAKGEPDDDAVSAE